MAYHTRILPSVVFARVHQIFMADYAFVIRCKLNAMFIIYGRVPFTAVVAMERGQMTLSPIVTQLIPENLLVFRELTSFQNLLQNWKSSLCVKP